jgi:nitrate reductase alpha subunit
MTMTDQTSAEGVLTAYGEANGALLVMALRPLQKSDPTGYMALMAGLKTGDIRLRKIEEMPINAPGSVTLIGIDSAGTERVIATLQLNPGALS